MFFYAFLSQVLTRLSRDSVSFVAGLHPRNLWPYYLYYFRSNTYVRINTKTERISCCTTGQSPTVFHFLRFNVKCISRYNSGGVLHTADGFSLLFFSRVLLAGTYNTVIFCNMNTSILKPFVHGSRYVVSFEFTVYPHCRC